MTAKKCTMPKCQRNVGTGKSSGWEDKEFCVQQGFCFPCGDEGQMDIAHTNGHENISEEDCWYCHPEKNEATKPAKAKKVVKGHHSPRRPQLNHKGCKHAALPGARRACREAFWLAEAAKAAQPAKKASKKK